MRLLFFRLHFSLGQAEIPTGWFLPSNGWLIGGLAVRVGGIFGKKRTKRLSVYSAHKTHNLQNSHTIHIKQPPQTDDRQSNKA
jgi:hypothetical protein